MKYPKNRLDLDKRIKAIFDRNISRTHFSEFRFMATREIKLLIQNNYRRRTK